MSKNSQNKILVSSLFAIVSFLIQCGLQMIGYTNIYLGFVLLTSAYLFAAYTFFIWRPNVHWILKIIIVAIVGIIYFGSIIYYKNEPQKQIIQKTESQQLTAEEIAAAVAKRIHMPQNVLSRNSNSTEKSKLTLPPTTEYKQISTLSKANAISATHSPFLTGEVTFDYSSHDGRFKFGNGDLVFESKWSSASNTRIHCYNDHLRGVAVAPIGADFSSLGNVSKLDFTSRSRSPAVGQFVVLENTKGFFALLLIVSIRATTHGDPFDELSFHYWIRPDGGSDFSKENIKPSAF
jgi:hypothetical protein